MTAADQVERWVYQGALWLPLVAPAYLGFCKEWPRDGSLAPLGAVMVALLGGALIFALATLGSIVLSDRSAAVHRAFLAAWPLLGLAPVALVAAGEPDFFETAGFLLAWAYVYVAAVFAIALSVRWLVAPGGFHRATQRSADAGPVVVVKVIEVDEKHSKDAG